MRVGGVKFINPFYFYQKKRMNPEELFSIGHLSKTTGNKGDLIMVRERIDEDLLFEQDALFVGIHPDYVPFMIVQLEAISDNSYRVAFEDIHDPEQAEKLAGKLVYIPVKKIPPESRHAFKKVEGYQVLDKNHGRLGYITGIAENPGQDLLMMKYENQIVLIPVVQAIIKNVDDSNRLIHTELPDGLLEINNA